MRTLYLKEDGVYLDDERIDFISRFEIISDAEEMGSTSQVNIWFVKRKDNEELIDKAISETVKVYGLDVGQNKPLYHFKETTTI